MTGARTDHASGTSGTSGTAGTAGSPGDPVEPLDPVDPDEAQPEPEQPEQPEQVQQGEAAADAAAAPAPPATVAPAGLTPHEAEVLRLLAEGRSDREIAAALFISPKTAGVHVSHLLGKLGVPSRAAAVAHAHRHGLV